MLSTEISLRQSNRFFRVQLVQTQTQLSRSLQEQFSCAQTQQGRILELLAPLRQIVQSVPLHVDIARNAILEKIPEGCRRCRCATNSCSSSSSGPPIPSSAHSNPAPLSNENYAESPLGARKKRRISLESTHPDSNNHIGHYQDQFVAVEARQTRGEFTPKLGENPASVQSQRNAPRATPQTPNGGKSGNDAVPHGYYYHGKARSGHGNNSALATRLLPTGSRGIAPFPHSRVPTLNGPPSRAPSASDEPISYMSSRVSSLFPYLDI
jgi:hypothetical protein